MAKAVFEKKIKKKNTLVNLVKIFIKKIYTEFFEYANSHFCDLIIS
jgi:hypothetical protein